MDTARLELAISRITAARQLVYLLEFLEATCLAGLIAGAQLQLELELGKSWIW
jgi:hypothetical protein